MRFRAADWPPLFHGFENRIFYENSFPREFSRGGQPAAQIENSAAQTRQ
jgi:hypothetical protein